MSCLDTALLVIDIQESFRNRPYWQESAAQEFLNRQQALIDGAKARGIPIVQVFHAEEDGPFSEASGLVVALSPITLVADAVFKKHRHSAFVGTGLGVWLTREHIHRLLISGIRTEQCCETTTRHGSDLGYAVDFVAESTLTFSMTDPSGREWNAAEIRARTELVLAGRFARIATVDEALAGPGELMAA